jgi:hypothetical protein
MRERRVAQAAVIAIKIRLVEFENAGPILRQGPNVLRPAALAYVIGEHKFLLAYPGLHHHPDGGG